MSSSSAISPSLSAMRALPSPLRVWINGAGKAGEKEGTTRGVCSHQAPLESARKSPRTDLQRRIPEVVVVRRRIGGVSKRRDLSGRVYASDAARAYASGRAELIESELRGEFPSFVKPMLQSHTSGGFWLGLARHFCTKHLPRRDSTVTLIDENGEETDTVYLAKKNGLSGGWRGFSLDHELVDGDALVFQLINPTAFKIYIVRTTGYGSK